MVKRKNTKQAKMKILSMDAGIELSKISPKAKRHATLLPLERFAALPLPSVSVSSIYLPSFSGFVRCRGRV